MADQVSPSLTAEHTNQQEREHGSELGDNSDMGSLFGDEEENNVGEDVHKAMASIETEVPPTEPSPNFLADMDYAMENIPSKPPNAPMIPQTAFSPNIISPPPPTPLSNTSPPPSTQILPSEPSSILPDFQRSPGPSPTFPESATQFLHRTSISETESLISPKQKDWILNDEKIALIKERDEAVAKWEEAKKQRDEASDDVEGMEKEVREIKRKFGGDRLEELEAENERLVARIEGLSEGGEREGELEGLRVELDVVGRERDGLVDEVRELREERDFSQQEFLKASNEREFLAQELSRTTAELETAKESSGQVITERDHLQEELITKNQELVILRESRDQLRGVVDELEKELELENDSKFQMVKAMEKLQDQASNANAEAEANSNIIAEMKETQEKLKQQISQLESPTTTSSEADQISTLRKQTSEQSSQITKLQDEVRAEKKASQKIVEDTAIRLAEKDRLLTEAIQKKFDTKARAESVMSAVEIRAKEGGDDLKAQLDLLTMELERSKRELESVRGTFPEQLRSFISTTESPPSPNNPGPITSKPHAPKSTLPRGEIQKRKLPVVPKPKSRKYYWSPDPSLRHPNEPEPIERMLQDETKYHDQARNAQNGLDGNYIDFPKWYCWEKVVEEGQGDGEKIFEVKRGWQKERVKRELRPKVLGSRVSERSTKGVAPERFYESGDEGRERGEKRRRGE